MIIRPATIDNAKDIANIQYNSDYPSSKYSLDEELKFAKIN